MKRRWYAAVLTVAMVFGTALPAGAQGSRNIELLFESQNSFNAINSDLAFWGTRAFAGNYAGFRIFDISDPRNPQLLSEFECFGPQNDPSVYDTTGDGEADVLFLSVDAVLTGPECGSGTAADPEAPDGWEGIRIFDVSDPTAPFQIGAVYQHCGSHTHTQIPDPDNRRVLLLNSSYPLRPGPTCGPTTGPEHGRDPLHGVVQVVEVPFDDPASAFALTELPIDYPGVPGNLWDPADYGLDVPGVFFPLRACHDIGVFLPLGLVAGACARQAQMWRIDPETMLPDTENPLWVYDEPVDETGPTGDPNDPGVAVDFWHSATFSWDGRVVNFIDESFAGFRVGGSPTECPPVTPETGDTGRMFFLDARTGEKFSHFMINRPEEGAYCSAHLGIPVPAKGKNLLVNAWYQGGVNVVDFTNPRKPKEIAFFDHEPAGRLGSDNWSAYWYETPDQVPTRASKSFFVYGNDGVFVPAAGRGFQSFEVTVGPVQRIGLTHLNPQTQEVMLRGIGPHQRG
jgi:hypothetical protein